MTAHTNGFSNMSLLSSTTEVREQRHVAYALEEPPPSCRSLESALLSFSNHRIMLTHLSQLFWGNMVAACGLGPRPIPYRTLDAQSLADAIQFCLQPSVQAAARDVANRMCKESGVTTAVASFHRNLPVDKMRCHFLPSEPAVWRFKKGPKPSFHMSKVAAEILIDHHRLKLTDLQP